MDQDSRREKILVFLLRGLGCVTLTAFAAMFLPGSWMERINALIGLGPLPRAPIVDYLARSISALYGFHGVLLLILARDVRRYRAIVAFVAWATALFGVLVTGIDLYAGMPAYWTWGEGPPIVVTGFVLLHLLKSVPEVEWKG